MYNNWNCKILQKKFDEQYNNLFMQMYIQKVYGNELVLGSTLLDNNEHGE